MSAPESPAAHPLAPTDEEAENASAHETLARLQGGVRQLLFTKPGDADSAATLTRLARQLNVYLNAFGQTRWGQPATDETPPPGDRPLGPPPPTPRRFLVDGGQLIAALDRFLADPSAGPAQAALEETITRICGTPPPVFRPPSPAVAPDPTPAPTVNQAPAMVYRSDASGPRGWQIGVEALRRRTTLALLLAGLACVGMVAMLVVETDRSPRSSGQRGDQGGPAAPATGPDGPTSAAARPDGRAGGLDYNDVQALRLLPERLAELDIQVLHLGARLEALETHQIATDRKLARAAAPTAETPAAKTVETSPSPAMPAADTRASRDRGSYGIQLATLKNPVQVTKFLKEHSLDTQQVRIEKAGIGTVLILGLFPDQAKAEAAIDSLQPALKRQRPMVRRFAPGQEPPRFETDSKDN